MRRPLLMAALCVVIITAVRLEMGAADRVPPDRISTRELDSGGTLFVTGQVYQKEEQSIYLKSVSIVSADSDAAGQSTVIPQQEIAAQRSYNINENQISGNLNSTYQVSGNQINVYRLNTNPYQINENLICETEQAPEIPLGCRVTLEGVFMSFAQASNPGEFDAAIYYRTLGIGGRLRETVLLSVEEGGWPVREGLYQLKSFLKERLYQVFPEKEAAVMSALLLGEKKGLDEDLKELYQRNGILHIFSISSLHITIIGMGVYKLLRRGGMPICPAACAGSVLLILYGCMTGFSVSACRAIGMYLLRMLAEMAGRTYDMLTALGVMAAVMVIRNPYYLQSGGFLLSFTSVLGIGVVFPALAPEKRYQAADENRDENREEKKEKNKDKNKDKKANTKKKIFGMGEILWIHRNQWLENMHWMRDTACLRKVPWISNLTSQKKMERKIKKKRNLRERLQATLQQSALASLSITLTTLPVQLWLYYEIPTYSIFLNLLVIPLLKPLMTAGILTLVPGLGFLSEMGSLILTSYEFLSESFERLPFHTWNPGRPAVWQMIVYYLLLLGVTAAGYAQKKEKSSRREIGINRGMDRSAAGSAARSTNRSLPKGMVKNTDEGMDGNMVRSADRSMAGGKDKRMAGGTGRRRDIGEYLGGNRDRNQDSIRHGWGKGMVLTSIAVFCFAIRLLGIRPSDTNSVTFLDVGQGDCIMVRTASGQTYLFDCGSSSRSSVGKYVLIPYLKYNGIHTIDAVFLSHPDADHVNGALELFELGQENRIVVRQLLLPAIEDSAREEEFGKLLQAVSAAASAQGGEIPAGYLSAGETWDCGGTLFTCLHPSEGYSGENANAYSECFYVEFRGEKGSEWSLLLTGDVEGTGEEALLKELRTRDIHGITVLKAAHHGSRNSSSEALLRQVNPNLTVISCGRNNRYGHPHKELLERLEQTDTYIMQTAESGAVTVTFHTGNLHVSSMLGKK